MCVNIGCLESVGADVLFYISILDTTEYRECDRFVLGIPYCGVELDCESYLVMMS